MRASAASCLAGLALLAAGCVESTCVFTLNPDGSGKVEVEAIVHPPMFMAGGTAMPRRVAYKIVTGSTGVDAWKGVEYGPAPAVVLPSEGQALDRARFRGTAYFRDVAELKLGGRVVCLKPKLDRAPTGQLVVTIAIKDKRELEKERASREPPDISEEELRRKIRKERDKYEDDRDDVVAIYSNAEIRSVFRLPGEPEEVSGFTRREDGSLEIAVDGQEIIAACDRVFADDELLREYVLLERSSTDGRQVGVFLLGNILDRLRACRVVLGGELAPLFDYEAEAAEARSGMKKIMEELAYGKISMGPPPGPGVVVWRDGEGPPRSGVRYPWRSVAAGGPWRSAAKALVPLPFAAGLALFSPHGYLRYPYQNEAAGSAFLEPDMEGPEGPPWLQLFHGEFPYVVLTDGQTRFDIGGISTRLSVSHLSGDGAGWRTEARVDFPGYIGLWGGKLDMGETRRSYFRFTNAFVMNTRAVASLDLGSVHTRGEDRFEWGVNADLFPRKPLLLHFAYHEFGGPDESDLRLSLGVAIKWLELTAGWTRLRDAGYDDDLVEAGVRLWWAF